LPALQIRKEKPKMKNIYVGNVSFNATEESIRALFETHGTVERVSLVTDRDTGQPRGFGFVEMTNDAEAEKAIAALNGREHGGRDLSVNEARPKTERSGGGGFRSGGGSGRGRRW
jgi:RNA recognition motif-containing protein